MHLLYLALLLTVNDVMRGATIVGEPCKPWRLRAQAWHLRAGFKVQFGTAFSPLDIYLLRLNQFHSIISHDLPALPTDPSNPTNLDFSSRHGTLRPLAARPIPSSHHHKNHAEPTISPLSNLTPPLIYLTPAFISVR